MAFATREESVDEGLPVSLFLIEYGDAPTAFFAYTDSEVPVVFGGKTYAPTTIGRDKIEASGTLDKTMLEIQITPNASLVAMYQRGAPTQVVRLTIFQGHIDDPDGEFLAVWTGRVIAINRGPQWATISGEPVATSLRRAGLRRHYQYGCPWALYGPQCKADLARATRASTVAVLGQNYVDLPSGWNGAFNQTSFQGGYMQWTDNELGTTTIRTIYRVTGDRLLFGSRVIGLAVGETVSVVLGCNHQQSDCRDLHLNIQNYGGQPYIPLANPIGFRNQYY